VAWYRYPLPQGGWEWRYVVATFPATPRTMLTWGKRRFTVEHFFRAAKSEFSLGQFGQRTALGVHRFLVLSLLAYLLAHWVGVEGKGSWREAREGAARVLLPELVVQVILRELHALGLGPPGGGVKVYAGYAGGASFELAKVAGKPSGGPHQGGVLNLPGRPMVGKKTPGPSRGAGDCH